CWPGPPRGGPERSLPRLLSCRYSHCRCRTRDFDAGVSRAFQIMSATFSRKATRLEEALLWYHFVPASGPKGRDWYADYQRSGGKTLCQRIDVSVALMRKRKINANKALLDECRAPIEALEARSAPRAVAGVVEEGYFGALAYF